MPIIVPPDDDTIDESLCPVLVNDAGNQDPGGKPCGAKRTLQPDGRSYICTKGHPTLRT